MALIRQAVVDIGAHSSGRFGFCFKRAKVFFTQVGNSCFKLDRAHIAHCTFIYIPFVGHKSSWFGLEFFS